MNKSNLVMGVVANYDWHTIEPFFISLLKSGYRGRCVIFAANLKDAVIKKLNSLGVAVIPFKQVRLENTIALNDFRFYLYLDYLKQHKDEFNYVMLADVRDVIFQKDPFAYGLDADKLNVSLEEGTFATNGSNSIWMLKKFGTYTYSVLIDERIICAGTTIGSQPVIMNYVSLLFNTMLTGGYFQNSDQAIHNFLVYTERIAAARHENAGGPIVTVSIDKKSEMDAAGNILTGDGKIASIVHQYDRCSEMVEMVNKRYRESV